MLPKGLYIISKKAYVTSYKEKGLPIGRLIGTFLAYGCRGRGYIVFTYQPYMGLVRLLIDLYFLYFKIH